MLAGSTAGAWLLRRSWEGRDTRRPTLLTVGCLVLAVVIVAAAYALGSARGTFVALTLIPICALVLVAVGLERRNARTPRRKANEGLAPEPLERPSVWWRTTLRWLLAGPIGMIAAMAVGICYSVWVPGEPQTRLMVAGLMVPVLWGGGMAWTLADNRVLRATAVLVGTAVLGFGAAILKGFT